VQARAALALALAALARDLVCFCFFPCSTAEERSEGGADSGGKRPLILVAVMRSQYSTSTHNRRFFRAGVMAITVGTVALGEWGSVVVPACP
jgi:hypothetical protein